MALPGNELSTVAIKGDFLLPDRLGRKSKVEDFERGGVALNNPTDGLDVRDWRIRILGTIARLGPYPEGPEIDLFFDAGMTEISLAFDQNMRPAVAYIANGVTKLFWYDTALAAQTTTSFGGGLRTPFLTLDDKRASQSSANDILFFYLVGTTLRYRMQRERYQTERTIYTGLLPNAQIKRVGMGTNLRLHIEIGNAGVKNPRVGGISAVEQQGADVFVSSGFVRVSGFVAAVDGPDSFASSGTVVFFPRSGSLSATESAPDVFTSTGKAPASGLLAAVEAANDAFASTGAAASAGSTVLLLHFDGTNGQTTTTDSSPVGNTISMAGKTLSTAQAKFGSASSGQWTGVEGPITLPWSSNFGFPGDLTFEGWIYMTSGSFTKTIFETYRGTGGLALRVSGSRWLELVVNGGTSGSLTHSGVTLPLNAWAHVALCRSAGVFSIYSEGTKFGTTLTDATNYTPSGATSVAIGSQTGSGPNPFIGFIDEWRVTKGAALYSASFTPPTAAFPNT